METEAVEEAIDFTLQTTENQIEVKSSREPEVVQEISENLDTVYTTDTGFLMLHKDHPEYTNLIRLQLENQELINWKQRLQAKINAERSECVRLKRIVSTNETESESSLNTDDPEYEKLVDHFMKENALLEQKRNLLAKEIIDENISLIELQVDLAMKQFIH